MHRSLVLPASFAQAAKSSAAICASRRDSRWAQYHQEAEQEYAALSQDPQFMFGLALLHRGRQQNQAEPSLFGKLRSACYSESNGILSDDRRSLFIVALRLAFTSWVACRRCRSLLAANDRAAQSAVPHKTTSAVSRASSGKKGNLQVYGTCQLYASNTKIRQKLSCWMTLSLTARSFIG